VIFNDVLEHLVDPWEALESTRDLLDRDGCVVASIPNVRHVAVIQPLVLRGTWNYTDSGILDRNHLRFFTRSTIVELFVTTGFVVNRLDPIRVARVGEWALVNKLSGGRLTGFLAQRFAVTAELA
jgi:hypothetical protein